MTQHWAITALKKRATGKRIQLIVLDIDTALHLFHANLRLAIVMSTDMLSRPVVKLAELWTERPAGPDLFKADARPIPA